MRTTPDPASHRIPRLRLGLLLWIAGMLGVVVVTVTMLPQLLGELTLPAPLWVISLASLAQSSVLVALAVWAGVALAPKVGLRAPAFEAAVTGRSIASAAWRFLQRRTGTPRALYVWLAIVVSALLFGAGHLPAAAALIGRLTAAHATAHLVSNFAGLL